MNMVSQPLGLKRLKLKNTNRTLRSMGRTGCGSAGDRGGESMKEEGEKSSLNNNNQKSTILTNESYLKIDQRFGV